MPTRLLRHPLGGGFTGAGVHRALYAGATDTFWLDSGDDGVSYLGAGEPLDLTAAMAERGVLDALRAELEGAAPAADDDAPPFRLGLVGWLGFELRGETMDVPVPRASRYPDAAFLRVDRAVAVAPDGSAELLALGDAWRGDLAAWRDTTAARLAAGRTAPLTEAPARDDPVLAGELAWQVGDRDYARQIAACQAAIREGEAYLLCLTNEATVAGVFDADVVYARLRAQSPSHHGALLRIGGVSLLSSSPERFIEATPDGVVRTHPIKGTRRRGDDPASDALMRDQLLASEKERAENVMIVDLMRNDLARVARVGSVTVPRLLEVESYPQVHQLVSTVEARLRDGLGAVDVIASCLPGGSMTGAPKQRATEILDALEDRPRGLYAGAFGYLGLDGRADLAMTIRSIVLDAVGATVSAGGGITALSDPADEVAEVHLKARALLDALRG